MALGDVTYDQDTNLMTNWSPTYTQALNNPVSQEQIPTFQFPSGLEVYPSSTSYSGLPSDYTNKLLSSLMPSMVRSVKNYPGQVNKMYDAAMTGYGEQLRNQLKTNIPSAINNLANRGVLDSTVASKTLADVTQQANRDYAEKGYQAAMTKAAMQAQAPTLLAQIAQLGASSQTKYTDPTEMYKVMAQLLMAQM